MDPRDASASKKWKQSLEIKQQERGEKKGRQAMNKMEKNIGYKVAGDRVKIKKMEAGQERTDMACGEWETVAW